VLAVAFVAKKLFLQRDDVTELLVKVGTLILYLLSSAGCEISGDYYVSASMVQFFAPSGAS
jgi:hypothetical protein